MKPGCLTVLAAAVVVAGCAAPQPETTPIGYRFHDANHPNDVSNASPQAIENAARGVWLWGPPINDSMRRGG